MAGVLLSTSHYTHRPERERKKNGRVKRQARDYLLKVISVYARTGCCNRRQSVDFSARFSFSQVSFMRVPTICARQTFYCLVETRARVVRKVSVLMRSRETGRCRLRNARTARVALTRHGDEWVFSFFLSAPGPPVDPGGRCQQTGERDS